MTIIKLLSIMMMYIFIFHQSKIDTPNIFIPTISFFWNDWENWSKEHVPYVNENIELSQGSVVQLYNPGVSTIIGKINVTNGCVLIIYSDLITTNTATIDGNLIIFSNVNISNLVLNNSLIWIMNNASIYSNNNILIGNNDIVITGLHTKSNIFTNVINNGKLIILPNTGLFIKKYLQTPNGILSIHYNRTIDNIGYLYGDSLLFLGSIFLECEMSIKNTNYCIPIISAINYLYVSVPITDICGHVKNYTITNNNVNACF